MMSNTRPLVSCIMPTTSKREKFIPMALQYFLRQDYPEKELVIVDDGKPSIEHLIPDDISVRYIRLENGGGMRIGAKRNHACNAAKGDIIMHWDDDDWYASDWISRQESVMSANDVDICGLRAGTCVE